MNFSCCVHSGVDNISNIWVCVYSLYSSEYMDGLVGKSYFMNVQFPSVDNRRVSDDVSYTSSKFIVCIIDVGIIKYLLFSFIVFMFLF